MRYVVAVVLPIFIWLFALGLPLLGWGITGWQGFFSNPARMVYGVLIGLFGLGLGAGFFLLRFPYIPGKREGESGKRVSRQAIVPIVTRLVWAVVFFVSPYTDRRELAIIGAGDAIRYAGLLVFAAGLAWVCWAFLSLGRQHSAQVTVQPGHRLVTRGPYRWLRHPMYLGLVVFPMGAGLAFRSWLGVLLPLLTLGLFVWRIGDEEALMQREFGEEWEGYCQRTWRLIPYLY